MPQAQDLNLVIIGGGPAGLTAAFEAVKAGARAVVCERDSQVGGIAKTVRYKGYYFDLGGHRFFTKVPLVEDIWHEVLGDEFLHRSRMSRIYFNKKFFHYPLRAGNALLGLGLWNSMLIGASYVRARLFPSREEKTFEQWVVNRFGRRLFGTFFKAYTEKVWGIPCSEISAEWAAQRIKGLSLAAAVKNALFGHPRGAGRKAVIKTLIDAFDYPRHGPGQLWEAVQTRLADTGRGTVLTGANVRSIRWGPAGVASVLADTPAGPRELTGTHYLSSMAMQDLVNALAPAPPAAVLEAARGLRYRDFVTVALIVNAADLFPDNWIYVHDRDVRVGRIQNFKNWSPDMVPDPGKTCLGLEYFCNQGDDLWSMDDRALVQLAARELGRLGLAREADVEDGAVVRVEKAYPVYDPGYEQRVAAIRAFVERLGNLQLIGRNGMHRYNNQDHSMLTAVLAVRNLLGERHDLWNVNVEQEYHEEIREPGRPGVAAL